MRLEPLLISSFRDLSNDYDADEAMTTLTGGMIEYENCRQMIEIVDLKEDLNAALLRRMSKTPEVETNKSTVVTKMLENEMDSLAEYHDEKNQEKIREMQVNYGLIPTKKQQDDEKISPFHFGSFPY